MKSSIVRKIRALQELTPSNGCTEAEALLAIEKINELIENYNISMSDIEVREESCIQFNFETNESRKEIDHRFRIAGSIMYLTQCKCWRSRSEISGNLIYKFFGRKTDLEFAKFLWETCMFAVDFETAIYKGLRRSQGIRTNPTEKQSFQLGMASRLSERINGMIQRQKAKSSGRDLVEVKMAYVNEEFKKLGINLSNGVDTRTPTHADAWNAGRTAGDKAELQRKVKSQPESRLLIGKA